MRYPSSLISCSQSGPSGACLTRAASCGFTQVGRDVRSTLRVGVIVETISQKRHDGRHNRYETSADDGCLCDRIRYEITQEPRLIYTCHRTECARLTSRPFPMAECESRQPMPKSGMSRNGFAR